MIILSKRIVLKFELCVESGIYRDKRSFYITYIPNKRNFVYWDVGVH